MRVALLIGMILACSLGCDPAADGDPRVAVTVDALSLVGVGDVVWDIEVRDAGDAVVWNRRVTSSSAGDGQGSATWVGPCDATPGANSNTVDVWVVGLYRDPIAPGAAGSFAAGLTSGAGTVSGTALPFTNPTSSAPLRRTVTCAPNQDTAVAFDVTLVRPAEQGFFDVAVAFDDIFCSAKLDCCADVDHDGCAADGSEDVHLLPDAEGIRERTFILALACTAGPDSAVVTTLLMDPLTLDCTPPSEPFAADLQIDPVGDGNLCTVGDVGSCAAVSGTIDPDDYLYQVAAYRGVSDANIVSWSVALGALPPLSGCRLHTRATSADAATSSLATTGMVPAGVVYPYIEWDADLGSCGAEAVTFDAPDAPVAVRYSDPSAAPLTFAAPFAPGAPLFLGPDIAGIAALQGKALTPVVLADRFVDPRGDGLTFMIIGDLPAGVAFDSHTATLSGTPSVVGSFVLSIRATNAHPVPTTSNSFTLTVTSGAPTFIGPSLGAIAGTQNQALSPVATAARFSDPGGRPLTFALIGSPPTGLVIAASSGVISGTPSVSGTFTNLKVRATNNLGLSIDSNAFTVTLGSGAPVFVGPGITDLTTLQHQPMTSVATASRFTDPGNRPRTYSFVGTPPTGITIASATGVISGTPTVSGTFANLKVRATNDVGLSVDSTTFTITVTSGAPTFSGTIATISANQNVAMTSVATAARFTDPGGRPLTYTFVGTPPAGISIASATGIISGTPTGSGTTSGLKVRATNNVSLSVDSNAFNITVAAAPSGGTSYLTKGTYTFTVPAGVTAISAVAIGGGGRGGFNGRDFVEAGASSVGTFITANPGGNGSVGSGGAGGGGTGTGAVINHGGNGGTSGNNLAPGAGGGAAGYTGDGGRGGNATSINTTITGQAGAGGGGAGGNAGYTGPSQGQTQTGSGSGGGVGVLGAGGNGAPTGGYQANGGGGSGGASGDPSAGGGAYGGGGGGAGINRGGGGGGGLVYRNNIPVTPGQQITVIVGGGASSNPDGNGNPAGKNGGAGAVRIIWGPTATF